MLRRIASALIPIALIALVVLPLALDQPFGTQTARTIEAIYAMRRWSPIVTVLGLAALAVLAAISLRRRRTWLSLVGFAGVLTLAIAAAWFARQNHFEWMFNPLPQPRLRRRRARRSFVDRTMLVMAVTIDGDAVAYPIRQIGLPPPRQRSYRPHADRRHVLNALPHRSGVELGDRRTRSHVSPGRHQQPELRDAGRRRRAHGGSRCRARRSSVR